MEGWVEETALRRSMVVSRTAWWRWDVEKWLPEQSRQWKGDSSASMVEPQEHKKVPGAQTSEDAGGGRELKAHTKGHGVFEGGAEGVPAVESPARSAEPAIRVEFSAQMARDWNPAWWRLRTRASAQRC